MNDYIQEKAGGQPSSSSCAPKEAAQTKRDEESEQLELVRQVVKKYAEQEQQQQHQQKEEKEQKPPPKAPEVAAASSAVKAKSESDDRRKTDDKAPKKKLPPVASNAAKVSEKLPEEKLSLFEQDKKNRKRKLNRMTAQRKRSRQRAELQDLQNAQAHLTSANKHLATENNALREAVGLLKQQKELRDRPGPGNAKNMQEIQASVTQKLQQAGLLPTPPAVPSFPVEFTQNLMFAQQNQGQFPFQTGFPNANMGNIQQPNVQNPMFPMSLLSAVNQVPPSNSNTSNICNYGSGKGNGSSNGSNDNGNSMHQQPNLGQIRMDTFNFAAMLKGSGLTSAQQQQLLQQQQQQQLQQENSLPPQINTQQNQNKHQHQQQNAQSYTSQDSQSQQQPQAALQQLNFLLSGLVNPQSQQRQQYQASSSSPTQEAQRQSIPDQFSSFSSSGWFNPQSQSKLQQRQSSISSANENQSQSSMYHRSPLGPSTGSSEQYDHGLAAILGLPTHQLPQHNSTFVSLGGQGAAQQQTSSLEGLLELLQQQRQQQQQCQPRHLQQTTTSSANSLGRSGSSVADQQAAALVALLGQSQQQQQQPQYQQNQQQNQALSGLLGQSSLLRASALGFSQPESSNASASFSQQSPSDTNQQEGLLAAILGLAQQQQQPQPQQSFQPGSSSSSVLGQQQDSASSAANVALAAFTGNPSFTGASADLQQAALAAALLGIGGAEVASPAPTSASNETSGFNAPASASTSNNGIAAVSDRAATATVQGTAGGPSPYQYPQQQLSSSNSKSDNSVPPELANVLLQSWIQLASSSGDGGQQNPHSI